MQIHVSVLCDGFTTTASSIPARITYLLVDVFGDEWATISSLLYRTYYLFEPPILLKSSMSMILKKKFNMRDTDIRESSVRKQNAWYSTKRVIN